ncbi:hypothetical protein [Bizionia sp.]|uniref:hypothetical protein n=1 Tax=Bizionia sp. TaxID=1954480 RepID=UPI003A90C262
MNIKKLAFTLFTIFIGLHVFSQKEIYMDENMKEIDVLTYSKKCSLQAFKCIQYDLDTLKINKVLPKFHFGKIDPTAYTQIRKLLMRDSKKIIKPNKTLIVKFYDSILPFEKALANYNRHMRIVHDLNLDSTKSINSRHSKLTEKSYIKGRKDFIKRSKKCKKKFEKRFNSEIFYLVDESNGLANTYTNFNWIADNGFFKNNFFKIRSHYSTVFIKPDGEYFLIGTHFPDRSANKLLKTDNWSKYKKDWQKTLTTERFKGSGIFQHELYYSHKAHCF